MKLLFIILFIIIIISLLRCRKKIIQDPLANVLEHNTNMKDADEKEDKENLGAKLDPETKKYIDKVIQGVLIPQGPPGKRGPKGEQGAQGPAGGVYINKGILRNNATPTDYIDRMTGIGNTSKIFLNSNDNVLPTQMWTFESENNKIKNFTGNCLSHKGKEVYMDLCSNSSSFLYDEKNLMIKSSEDTSKCLTLQNSNSKVSEVKKGKMKDSSLRLVSMEDCNVDDNLNQQWFFN